MARVERHIFADHHLTPVAGAGTLSRGRALGVELLRRGMVSSAALLSLLADQRREAGRLTDQLRARGLIRENDLLAVDADRWGISRIDLGRDRPDPRLVDAIGAMTCLQHGLVPVRRAGDVTVVAISRPDEFPAIRPRVEEALGPIVTALAAEREIVGAVHSWHGPVLAATAESCVPAPESCRGWARLHHSPRGMCLLSFAILAICLAPITVGLFVMALSICSMVLIIGLKLLAIQAALRAPMLAPPVAPIDESLPIFSIIIALYREADITARLVQRLARLHYPLDRLDVLLAVEAEDQMTRAALDRAALPAWMRVVVVPKGAVRTKPRALNHALEFCRGSIIGIYDAEDAPDPLQLLQVVGQFRISAPDVACLQGILDYYNPRTNWISRCFTAEYAGWFRLVLPGIARLGLAVPLGGTTLFLRRDLLESLGGWDAWNVTEDADLGVRLARHGYRTEMINTTTEEEANCRPLAWIKQRSRWIKGYLMTWAVHMRNPVLLWRQVGPRAFLGFQVMFIGTSLQFLLVPLFLSFLVVPFGLHHPLFAAMPTLAALGITLTFALGELINLSIWIIGLRRTRHRLSPAWALGMSVYFALACIAAYKAVYEIATRPFFWDKTRHGLFDQRIEGP